MSISVMQLLPDDARKPVDKDTVELIARGLLRPSPAIAQRLAIDLQTK